MKEAEEILTRSDDVGRQLALDCLADTIHRANEMLLDVADEKESARALDLFAFHTLEAVNCLTELARSKPEFVKRLARTWPSWPALVSPHKDVMKELVGLIKRLGVGHAAPENVWGKWSDMPAQGQLHRTVLAKYARRMMIMLQRLHGTVLRKRFATRLRHAPLFLNDNCELTTEERKKLVQEFCWPAWIVDAACLPPFSNESARDWFEVGWAALKEAAGGNVASIPELRPAGESRAEYWRRASHSKAQQESQRENQIHERLRDVFLKRYKHTG